MQTNSRTTITVETLVKAPVERVWEYWTMPQHITKWNFASDDWHAPKADNDLKAGGRFSVRMEAKDGSFGFDFGGIYDQVVPNKLLSYTMDDGRKAKVDFQKQDSGTLVQTSFEAESEHPADMQKEGWQAISNNFKKYIESLG